MVSDRKKRVVVNYIPLVCPKYPQLGQTSESFADSLSRSFPGHSRVLSTKRGSFQ